MKTKHSLEDWRAPIIKIDPVPVSLDLKKWERLITKISPSWKTIFRVTILGLSILCIIIFSECIKNEIFLRSLK
jgi:hypothetical protein